MMEWTIPIGTVLMVVGQTVGMGVAIVATSTRIQRALDAKFSEQDLSLERIRGDLKLKVSEITSSFQKEHADQKDGLMTVVTKVETDVRDLSHRVGTLEAGQDEWTKSLRKRTHDLAEQLNAVVLKVDRLERPMK